MEFRLPDEIKEHIYNEIISLNNPFALNENFTLIDFLSKLINLKDLPSEDERFENAYEDAVQHLVNNDDWDYNYTFRHRFKILENNELFKKFVEIVISDVSNLDIIAISSIINNYIEKFNYKLIKSRNPDGNPVFIIREIDLRFNIFDIPENKILFYVTKKNEIVDIEDYPCFLLEYDFWDDFGFKTRFELSYYDVEKKYLNIGKIKILKRGEYLTYDVIDKKFCRLSNEYCSLFLNEYSYFELKEIFGNNFDSILAALNDAAYFPIINEKFENEKGFIDSLCRNDKESEKILRTVRHKLNYEDISDLFVFNYLFTPLYSQSNVNFNFDFNGSTPIAKRVYSVIGKNGVGKTLMIKDLLENLSKKNSEIIKPRIPLYGKIILVSFSYFDAYEKIKNKLDFNYLFCGLVDIEEKRPLTYDEIKSRLIISLLKLTEKNVLNKYFFIIREFIDEEVLRLIIKIPSGEIDLEYFRNNEFLQLKIDIKRVSEVVDKMSSGQLALFYIITEIIANIRYNSLLIFDEPETHLHPNAITEFMSALMLLLEEFDSYCIIATHSPLIVREIFSDCIYVFEKEENVPSIRKLEFETFGENLSTLTDEIFNNRDVPKYFFKSIEKLVEQGKSYEEIENLIQGEVPLNLNVKILIKSLVKNRDEESEVL